MNFFSLTGLLLATITFSAVGLADPPPEQPREVHHMIVCEDKGTALGAIYDLNKRIAGQPHVDSYADTGVADQPNQWIRVKQPFTITAPIVFPEGNHFRACVSVNKRIQ